MSGALPVDEVKRLTRQAAEQIDVGNKILGLDLVIRDKDGHRIRPMDTSTIQLFYMHKTATERMTTRSKVSCKIILISFLITIKGKANFKAFEIYIKFSNISSYKSNLLINPFF